MSSATAIQMALATLPDIPRWVEARAVLSSGHCTVLGRQAGFLIRNDAPGGQLIVAVGEPSAGAVAACTQDRRDAEILCAPESQDHLAGLLTGWMQERALLFELEDEQRLAETSASVRALQPSDSLDHLPTELREELQGVDPSIAIWCAFEGSLAASFAYAYWRTEGLFDLSIDTVPEFRRRGLARLAVSECIRQESASGRKPVWGAMQSNSGSRRLAQSLGFVEHDSVVLFAQGS